MENALTVTQQGQTPLALVPLDDGMRWSNIVLKSGLAPTHFKTPEAVYVAVCMGEELGLTRLQALNSMYVVGGKPGLEVSGMKALILRAGGRFNVESWDDKHCTITMIRGDWTETQTYSIEDAKRQGLAGKDNWTKMPKNMLYARCFSNLARNLFADVLKGVYSKEELTDGEGVATTTIAETPKIKVLEMVEDDNELVPYTTTLKLVDAFKKLMVDVEILEEACGKTMDAITKKDLEKFKGVYHEVTHGVDLFDAIKRFFAKEIGNEA